MVRWWAIGWVLAACYSPHPQSGAPCAADRTCPDPLVCIANLCVPPGTQVPDAPAHPDASSIADAPPDAHRAIDASPDAFVPPGPALVQQATNKATNAASLSATFTAAPANGDLLVMVGAANGGSLTSVSGAATWTKATANFDNANVEIWYGYANGTESQVTIARTGNINNMWLSISEWSGMAASAPLDGASSNGGLSNTATEPAIVTTHPHDILIFAVADTEPTSLGTPGPGVWTALISTGPTPDYIQDEWYREVTITGSYQPSVSSNGCGWDSAVAAFKAAN